MPRAKYKYHYLYKTTNLINNKFYVGMHSTSNLEDGYLGSGLRLRRSIRKYGKENFKFDILEFFEDREKLIEAEINMVNSDLIKEELCMNIKEGGCGGFSNDEHQKKCSIAGNTKQDELRQTDIEWNNMVILKNSIRMKNAYISGIRKKPQQFNFVCKIHSEETKEKMREKAKLRTGNKNNSFGTCWIMKDDENKKIKKEELENYLNLGWIKGRKIK